MKLLITFWMALATSMAMAQQPTWIKSLGGVNSDICRNIGYDADGNVYISGYINETVDIEDVTLTSNGGPDIFIAKFTKDGSLTWAHSIGGTQGDEPEDMYIDAKGNIVLTGHFKETVDFDPGAGTTNKTSGGSSDIFVALYDTDAKLEWVQTLGGVDANSNDRGQCLDVIPNKSIFIAGHHQGDMNFVCDGSSQTLTGNGGWDGFYARYDFKGNCELVSGFGSVGKDVVYGIAVTPSADIYMTGQFEGSVDMDPSASTTLITSNGREDIFLVKYDKQNDLVWTHGIGGSRLDVGRDVDLDKNQNLVVTGHFYDTVNFDPQGGTAEKISNGLDDIVLAQYNKNGVFQWANSYGSTLRDRGFRVFADDDDNIFTTGFHQYEVDFDPGAGVSTLPGNGVSWDAYFAKYDEDGDFLSLMGASGPDLDYGYDICRDPQGDIYIGGRFTQETTINPGSITLTTAGINDAFFGKFAESPSAPTILKSGETLTSSSTRNNQWYKDGVLLDGETGQTIEVESGGDYTVLVFNEFESSESTEVEITLPFNASLIKNYPNPSEGRFSLQLPVKESEQVKVELINGFGQVIWSQTGTGSFREAGSDQISAGTYTLTVSSGNTTISKRIIVF